MADAKPLARDQPVGGSKIVYLDAKHLALDGQGKRETRPLLGEARRKGNAAAVVSHAGEAIDESHPAPSDRCDMRAVHHVAADVGEVHDRGKVDRKSTRLNSSH